MNSLGKPIGMAIGPGTDAQAKEVLEQFTGKAKPALDLLMDHLLAAVSAGDGVMLGLWCTTLRGLVDDLEGVLTRQPAVVVKDEPKQ